MNIKYKMKEETSKYIYKHKNIKTFFLDLKKVKIGSRIFFFFAWVLETIKLFPKFLSWLYQGFSVDVYILTHTVSILFLLESKKGKETED